MLPCWNCQSLNYSCSTGSSTMKMAYSRRNCTSNHLGTMMLVFRAVCPHQSIDAFIMILSGTTHTPLEQLSFTKCHEWWLQQCGKTLASKAVIPMKSTIGKKTNTQILTGPLGLLALQAPWYKLNDDHGSLTYGSKVSTEKLITEGIRFILN